MQKALFFGGLCILILIDETSLTFVVPIIPDFLLKQGVSLSFIGFILSFYQISYFFASLYMGKRLMFYNKTHVMLVGQIVLVFSNLALSFLNYGLSTILIIVFSSVLRLLQGLAIALSSSGIYAYVHILFPSDLDRKYAVLEISLGCGLALGPVIGGFFYEYAGYTGAFIIMTMIYAAITLILFPFFMKFKLVFEKAALNEEHLSKTTEEKEKKEKTEPLTTRKILKNRNFLLTFWIFVCEYGCYNLIQPGFSSHVHDYDGSDDTVGMIFGLGDLTYALTGLLLVRFLKKVNVRRKYLFLFGGLMSFISLLIIGPEDYTFLPKNLITVSFGMGVLGFAQMCYIATLIPEYLDIFREIDPNARGSEELACGLFNASIAGTEFIGDILGGVLSDNFGFSRGMTIYAMFLLGVLIIFAVFRKVSKTMISIVETIVPFQQELSLMKLQFVMNSTEPSIEQTLNTWRNFQEQNQNFLEETLGKSKFYSQNNTLPLISEHLEIYYIIYYLKKVYKNFHAELLNEAHMHDESFLKLLSEKTLSLKEITKSQGQILNYIITSHSQSIKFKESTISILNNKKIILLELSAHIMHRRDFESKYSSKMAFFRKKVETLKVILKDCESLLALNMILSEDPQDISTESSMFFIDIEQPGKAVNNDNEILTLSCIETKDIYSFGLGKYEEYQVYLTKLYLAYQSFCEYYKLNKGSQEFLSKIQALIKMICEVLVFLKLGYNDIVVINRKIAELLRRIIEEIKEELLKNNVFFDTLNNSYCNVKNIISIRFDKIKYLNSEFEGIRDEIFNGITGKFVLEYEKLEISEDFFKVMEEDEEKIRSFRKKLRLLKIDIKNLRDDNSLLFFTIRLIQSKKTLKFLNLIISKVNSLLFLIGYLRNSLGKEIIYAMGLVKKSKGDFTDKLEKRKLQGKISFYNERIQKILSIPAFDPIKRIPRKLSVLLENAYDYLENTNNGKGLFVMGSSDKQNYMLNGFGNIIEENRANRPKETDENKEFANNKMNKNIENFDEKTNSNNRKVFKKQSYELIKYGSNKLEEEIDDFDEIKKIDNGKYKSNEINTNNDLTDELGKHAGNKIFDSIESIEDLDERKKIINIREFDNKFGDNKKNNFFNKIAENFKNKCKKGKLDQDVELDDLVYGWDSYYISEGED